MEIATIRHLATQAKLKRLFQENSYFSVCDVRALCQMNGVVIPREVSNVMQTCHCISYADMDPRLRAWLFDELLKAFSAPALDLSAIDAMRPPQAGATVVEAAYELIASERHA